MRLHLGLALIAPLALLGACQQAERPAPAEEPGGEAPPEPPAPVEPEPEPGGAEKVEEKTDAYEFTYGWPAAVGAIPALRNRLATERDARRARLAQEVGDWQREAEENGFNAPGYSFMKTWEVVTDLPRFLSLSAGVYRYTGGAHGMSTSDALVWDRQTGKAMKPIDMFLSEGSLDRAAQIRFCDELDRQRAKKRGRPVQRGGDDFDACIAPVANSTVILGSASGQAFDRIGFLVPPYNAGPYAEGEYEVTLPVDAALIDAVKPEYQGAFTPAG